MVKTANPKPHGVRGPYSRPGAKQANIDICNDYHQRQDYYDAQAAAAPKKLKPAFAPCHGGPTIAHRS